MLCGNIYGEGVKEVQPDILNNILTLAKNKTLFFNLPASKELASVIKTKLSEQGNISIVDDAASAQYILYGTIDRSGNA